MPYTTGAAPVKYFNLHESRDCATAATREVGLRVARSRNWFCSLPPIPSLSNTDCDSLSMSLSVTSHRFATRVGLGIFVSIMGKEINYRAYHPPSM